MRINLNDSWNFDFFHHRRTAVFTNSLKLHPGKKANWFKCHWNAQKLWIKSAPGADCWFFTWSEGKWVHWCGHLMTLEFRRFERLTCLIVSRSIWRNFPSSLFKKTSKREKTIWDAYMSHATSALTSLTSRGFQFVLTHSVNLQPSALHHLLNQTTSKKPQHRFVSLLHQASTSNSWSVVARRWMINTFVSVNKVDWKCALMAVSSDWFSFSFVLLSIWHERDVIRQY